MKPPMNADSRGWIRRKSASIGVDRRFLPARRYEGSRVDQLHCGDLGGIERDVDGPQRQAPERAAPDAHAGHTLSGLGEAVVEIRRREECVPRQPTAIVVQELEYLGGGSRNDLRDFAVSHL